MMKNYKIFFVLGVVVVAITSCQKNLLEKIPIDTVTTPSLFKTADGLQSYVNQFYDRDVFSVRFGKPGASPGDARMDIGTDNLVTSDRQYAEIFRGTRNVPTSGGGYSFGNIRKVNFFLDHYKECQDPLDDYKQYLGEAYFFRAWFYFKLLKQFGAVPWFDHVVKSTDEAQLFKKRTPRNIVADNIISDLDSAAKYIPANTGNKTRLTKWAALLFQARVALFEGTWEKYHHGSSFGVSNSNPEKYLEKVVQAVTIMMNSGDLAIYNTGNPQHDYYDLFIERDYSGTKEVIMWKQFSDKFELYNKRNWTLELPRGLSITKSLADAFLCIDGKPISVSPLFVTHDSLMGEAQNRDPRFKQTIFTPDAPWKIADNGDTTEYWRDVYTKLNHSTADYYAPTGYCIRKMYDARVKYFDVSHETDPVIIFRYAEALLAYAEAKAEMGNITQSDLDRTINVLRDRVGMPHLMLNNITTDPDWKFPSLSPIINEVRRERRVEYSLSLYGQRLYDILRWAAAPQLIVGQRPKGFKATQTGNSVFPTDEKGFLDPFQSADPNGYHFDVDRDYLSPIPLHEITLYEQQGSTLEQNPGW